MLPLNPHILSLSCRSTSCLLEARFETAERTSVVCGKATCSDVRAPVSSSSEYSYRTIRLSFRLLAEHIRGREGRLRLADPCISSKSRLLIMDRGGGSGVRTNSTVDGMMNVMDYSLLFSSISHTRYNRRTCREERSPTYVGQCQENRGVFSH